MNRKTIKITLPAKKVISFDTAKKAAEDASMMKMSDAQYASRLLQWALDYQLSENRAAVTVLTDDSEPGALLDVSGHRGTDAYAKAERILHVYLDAEYERKVAEISGDRGRK